MTYIIDKNKLLPENLIDLHSDIPGHDSYFRRQPLIWFALEILKSSIIWIIFLISLLTTTLLWYSFELFWQCEKDLMVILIHLFPWSCQMLLLLSIIVSTWATACWRPGCSLAALKKYHSQMDLLHFLGAYLHLGAICFI